MTEAEWLACTDPQKMLAFLRFKASDRKLRLFACACCRRVWHLIPGERDRETVETAERFADGMAGKEGLKAARRKAGDPIAKSVCYLIGLYAAWRVPLQVSHAVAKGAASETVGLSESYHAWSDVRRRELRCLRGPLRDIVGPLPFRPAALNPAWVAWNDGTVRRLAEAIYEERAFDRLPVLADALEEAGCDNADLLSHCRGPGPHVRGCWALDLLLARE